MSTAGEVSAYDRMVVAGGRGGGAGWSAASGAANSAGLVRRGRSTTSCSSWRWPPRRVTPDPQRCVYYVPGLMGSQLELARERPQPDNLLWLDPCDIQQSNLAMLAIPGRGAAGRGAGAVRLPAAEVRAAGRRLHRAQFRLRLAAEHRRHGRRDWPRACPPRPRSEINLVGAQHGGPAGARRAARPRRASGCSSWSRWALPHGGSFAPVQAVRGSYPLVRRLAQLDPRHDAETLAREVFSSFHSLYQMLPRDGSPDLINQRNWPATGPQPNATLLDRVKYLQLGGQRSRASPPSPAMASRPSTAWRRWKGSSTTATALRATARCRRHAPCCRARRPGTAMPPTTSSRAARGARGTAGHSRRAARRSCSDAVPPPRELADAAPRNPSCGGSSTRRSTGTGSIHGSGGAFLDSLNRARRPRLSNPVYRCRHETEELPLLHAGRRDRAGLAWPIFYFATYC